MEVSQGNFILNKSLALKINHVPTVNNSPWKSVALVRWYGIFEPKKKKKLEKFNKSSVMFRKHKNKY